MMTQRSQNTFWTVATAWLAECSHLSLRHPILALSLFLGSAVLCGWFCPRPVFDFGLEQLLARGDAEFRRYQALGEWFGRDDNTVSVFLETPDLFSPQGVRRVMELSEDFAASPLVKRVASLASVPLVERRGNVISIRPPFTTERASGLAFSDLRERLLKEPIFSSRLLSPDGRTTSFILRLREDVYGDRHRKAVLAHVHTVIERHRGAGTFWITGNVPTRQAYLDLLVQDALLLLPLTSLLLAVALYLIFRHWVAVVVPLAVIAMSQAGTFVVMTWMEIPVTLLSISVPVILTVVGSSDAVHYLTRYTQELAAGISKRAALQKSLEKTLPALLVTSATTAAGFLALLVTDIPLLEGFGLLVASGIAVAFLTTVLVAPPLLMMLPAPPRPFGGRVNFFSHLSSWVTRRPRTIAAAAIVLSAVVAVGGARRLRVESKLIDDVSPQHAIAVNRRAVASRMGGTFPLTFLVHAVGEHAAVKPRAALEPAFLRKVAEFERALREQTETPFSSCLSAADVFSSLWRGMGRTGELPPSIEEVRELASHLPGYALAELFVPGARSLRIDVWMHDRGTHETYAFVELARKPFREIFGRTAQLEIQGFAYLAHKVHASVVSSTLQGFVLSFVLVSLLLLLMFRSPGEVLMATITNLVPAALTLSFMGFAGIDLRIASVIVFSVVFGVAVDDTVHFLARYREETAASPGPSEAVRHSLVGTGVAMTATSIVLTLGFLVLLLGQFRPGRELGVLMAVATMSALFADLIILPALLLWWRGSDG